MNILKKTTIIILMMIICLSLFSVISKAAIKGKIIADNIRLRSEANTDSKILTLVSINDEVDVIEKDGDWYKIEYKGKTGYIKSDFIKLKKDNVKEENESTDQQINDEKQNQETIPEQTEQEIITGERTIAQTEKLYILPLLNSKVIYTIEANKVMEVVQNVNGWSYVMLDEVSGWIRTNKLVEKQEEVQPQEEQQTEVVEEPQEEEEQPTEKEVNKKGYIKATSVNFRKEPSKTADVLSKLTINTEITVITEQEDWYKIKVNNKTGYVAKELVSFEKVEVTSRNEDEPRKNTQVENTKEENTVPTDTASSSLGQQIVDYAMTFKGYPYVYGGSTPSGFDCSGFTSYVYKHFGYSISRSSSAQANNGVAVAKSDLQLGDLVLFKGQNSSSIGHVGIYIGNNQFIHASTYKTGVKISSLSAGSYIQRYVTARRII